MESCIKKMLQIPVSVVVFSYIQGGNVIASAEDTRQEMKSPRLPSLRMKTPPVPPTSEIVEKTSQLARFVLLNCYIFFETVQFIKCKALSKQVHK